MSENDEKQVEKGKEKTVSKTANGSNATKGKKASKGAENGRLPVLLEIVFDSSKIIMLVVPLAVAIISYTSGAKLLDIVIRTGVAIIAVGLISIGITRGIVNTSLEVTKGMIEKASETETSVERQA